MKLEIISPLKIINNTPDYNWVKNQNFLVEVDNSLHIRINNINGLFWAKMNPTSDDYAGILLNEYFELDKNYAVSHLYEYGKPKHEEIFTKYEHDFQDQMRIKKYKKILKK